MSEMKESLPERFERIDRKIVWQYTTVQSQKTGTLTAGIQIENGLAHPLHKRDLSI